MKFVAFLFSALFVSCLHSNSASTHLSLESPQISYDSFLKNIKFQKDTSTLEQKQNLLFTSINKQIPSYWMGTPWDFNGTSRKPKKGMIACGYFVTNTLSDLGFDIKRIYLAQQASSVMIKQLCTNVKSFGNLEKVKAYLAQQKENDAFIVGLDFHTGYITKEGADYYFIHSNYIDAQGVVKEKLDESAALASNAYFLIGSLVQNTSLISNW